MPKSSLQRIDNDLTNLIKDFAKKNNLNFRQASKEIALLNRKKFANKKIIKEIKF